MNGALKELKFAHGERPFLVTETPTNPQSNREKITEITFETYNAPSYYLALQPVLSLYSGGQLHGLVLESGDGVTHAMPVKDGNPIRDGVMRLDLAGSDLTKYLSQLMSGRDLDVCVGIKEKLCEVALDVEKDASKAPPTEYALPDGQVVSVGGERFRCPEALFQPKLTGCTGDGIHALADSAIKKCSADIHKLLSKGIYLAGGTMVMKGMTERIQKEVEALVEPGTLVKVEALPKPKISAWIGGSILACVADFQAMWITKQQYEETGPSIVNKCI